MNILKKWFNTRNELLLFSILAFAGIITSFATYGLVASCRYNSGKSLAGVFVAPLTTIFFLIIVVSKNGFGKMHFVKCLVLFCLQLLPYSPLFLQQVIPVPYDDYSRYVQYATNMYAHHTLWGGDRLIYSNAGLHYVTQPGYRYFIYLELLAFGNLYRVLTFIQSAMYVFAAYCLVKMIVYKVKDLWLRYGMLALVLLMSPYAIKNSMLGLQEWLTVLLLAMGLYSFKILNRPAVAVFLLALVPFMRQNLLISMALIVTYIIINSKQKIRLVICFFVPLLLPLYHNLYYANSWRFFVDMHRIPFVAYKDELGTIPSGIDYKLFLTNLLHYAGFEMEEWKLTFSFLAFIFIPYAVLLYYFLLKSLSNFQTKGWFLLVTMSAVIPSFLLGSAYYPRFEFINVSVAIAGYILLCPEAEDAASMIDRKPLMK